MLRKLAAAPVLPSKHQLGLYLPWNHLLLLLIVFLGDHNECLNDMGWCPSPSFESLCGKIPQFPSIQSPKQQITTQAAKKNWQPAHPQKKIQALCVAFPVQNICKPKFIESALGIRSLTLRSRRLITRIVNCYWKNQAKIFTPTTSQSDWLRDSRSTQWARAEYKRPQPAGWWMVFRGCRWMEAAKWDVWMSLMAKKFKKIGISKKNLGMTSLHIRMS